MRIFKNGDISALGVGAVLVFLLCINAWIASPVHAQVSGATLSGLITDERGGPVPGATVIIRNEGTGVVREVKSNSDGLYSAPNLLPGTYEVKVSAASFQTLVQKQVTLTVGAQQPLNFSLKLGELTQVIEVNATPPVVQTTSSTISATVDSTTVRELPLNGRDWTSLATLEPGVTSIPNQASTGFSANKGNRGFGNQLSNGGHRANENTYRINGVTINDYSNGAPGGATGLNLGVDGIQEFSVLTSDYGAEYGRTSGAVINAIMKSGTNDLHGTAFLFDRDKIFDAKNYFDPANQPIPSFRRVQFGASGGTAIIKDKTFVYGAYEGVRQNQPLSRLIIVPSAAQRASASPAVQPYLALWPVAPAGTPINTNGTQTFPVALAGIATENYFTTRVDHKLSSKDSLAFSYFWDSGPQSQPDPLKNAIHEVFSRRQMASAEDTHIFSPQFVNTLRLGVSRVRGDINNPASGTAAATNTALAIAPGASAPPEIRVPGIITNAIGLGGLNRFLHRWNSGQLYDDAFLTRGTHSIKLGFAFERMQYNILEKLSPNGRISYVSMAQFLGNTPRALTALAPGGSNEVGIRESLFAGYIQDDWRARSNFTVNLGLRYEMTTRPTDANNRIQEITTLSNCATPGTPPNANSPCGPVRVNSFIANNPTLKDFEPRIGFSYDPFKNGRTAVRAGFGIFDVLPLPYEFGLNTSATFPFQVIGSDPAATLGRPATVSFNPNVVRNRYVQQDPNRSYVLNWNFNIQREITSSWTATVGYIGSRSVHLSVAADDINLVPPVQTSAGLLIPRNAARLNPNWGGGNGIRPVLFDGESTYHGLQSQIKKTMSHGFQGQVSYTLGKCRDTSSAPVTGDTYVNSIAVPLLLSKAYRIGACDFDIRHTAVGTVIWQLPGPKSASFASYLVGGWELGTIFTVASGSPFTVTVGGGGDPLGTGYNGDFSMDYAAVVPGCNATPGVSTNAKGQLLAFNPNCFTLPQATPAIATQCAGPFIGTGTPALPQFPGTCTNLVGNSGRNNFYGPGLRTVDFSIFKNARIHAISENFNVQFRAEFFNILNHPNFAAPNFLNDGNNSIADERGRALASAGVIGSTVTTARQIQLGLKLVW